MRWKKTDIETKAKIIEAKICNPNKSSRDIAQDLWWIVSNDTVCDVLNNDLPQVATESIAIADLVTRNNKLQSSADDLIAEMIANKNESITIAQLTTLRESTFKQNQLLKWESTENIWISWYDLLQDIKSGKLSKEQAYEAMQKAKSVQ
jgi:hypothetical protein